MSDTDELRKDLIRTRERLGKAQKKHDRLMAEYSLLRSEERQKKAKIQMLWAALRKYEGSKRPPAA